MSPFRSASLLAVLLATSGCEEDDPVGRPGEGLAPLFDPDLARCEALSETTVDGWTIARSTWTWDADGQRATVEDDLDADGEVDRTFEDTWEDEQRIRTTGEGVESDYTFEETRHYSGPNLTRVLVEEHDPEAEDEDQDRVVRSTYHYDLGILEEVRVDEDDDGSVDEVIEYVWHDDYAGHDEVHEDGTRFTRWFDVLGRVVRQLEDPADDDEPVVSTTWVYDTPDPLRPRLLQIDLDDDGDSDLVMRWVYNCP